MLNWSNTGKHWVTFFSILPMPRWLAINYFWINPATRRIRPSWYSTTLQELSATSPSAHSLSRRWERQSSSDSPGCWMFPSVPVSPSAAPPDSRCWWRWDDQPWCGQWCRCHRAQSRTGYAASTRDSRGRRTACCTPASAENREFLFSVDVTSNNVTYI